MSLRKILLNTILLLCITLSLAGSEEECLEFLDTEPEPIESNFFGNKDHGYFTQFITKDRDYELRNVIKFNVINVVNETKERTALCVGIVDTTSYTINLKTGNNGAIAWATINTEPGIPTGIILVDAECWSLKRDVIPCSPTYLPMPGVMDTALYRYSPLSPEYWPLLREEQLFARNWVWRMNTQSKEEKFPSSWLSNITIRSLRDLQIKGNDWGRPRNFLTPLPNLQRLDLTDNNIQELPSDLLTYTPRLRDLLLARNNLSAFPENLDRLDNLKLLDITNPIGRAELTISISQISTVEKVHIIGLENVNLNSNITGLLCLQKLKFLNLSGCGINNIDDINPQIGFAKEEKMLEILDLSNNNLDTLPSRLFSSLRKLKALRIHLNKFHTCPESLEFLLELDYLDLSRNFLSEINNTCLKNLKKKLQYLDLSRNQISFISEDTFHSFVSLKTLKLSENKLTLIFPLTFPSIRTVDLSRNEIVVIRIISHINSLNLSYNYISSFTEDMLISFKSLDVLDLGGNPFNCCNNLTLMKTWLKETHIDIRNLGTKDQLECMAPGSQTYAIKNLMHEQTLCQGDTEPTFVETINGNLLIITMVPIIILMFVLIILLFVSLFYYRNRINKKFLSLP